MLLPNTRKKPKLKWGSASSAANSQAELAILPAILGCIQHLILAPVAPYPSPSIGAVDYYHSTTVHAVAAYCRGSGCVLVGAIHVIHQFDRSDVQYSTAWPAWSLHLAPVQPVPRALTDRLGQAQRRAGRRRVLVRLLSPSGPTLGAQFNFSRDTSAVLLPLLHRPRGASKSIPDREKAPAPPVLHFCMPLGREYPVILPGYLWFAPASNPSQRVRPAVAQQPSKPPFTPLLEGP